MTARANILNLNQGLLGGVAGSMGRDAIGDSLYRNLQLLSFGFPPQTFSGSSTSTFLSVPRIVAGATVPVDLMIHLNFGSFTSEFVLDIFTIWDIRELTTSTYGNFAYNVVSFTNVTSLFQFRFLTAQPNQYLMYRLRPTTAGTNRTFGFQIRNWSYRNELLDDVRVTYTASGGGVEP